MAKPEVVDLVDRDLTDESRARLIEVGTRDDWFDELADDMEEEHEILDDLWLLAERYPDLRHAIEAAVNRETPPQTVGEKLDKALIHRGIGMVHCQTGLHLSKIPDAELTPELREVQRRQRRHFERCLEMYEKDFGGPSAGKS